MVGSLFVLAGHHLGNLTNAGVHASGNHHPLAHRLTATKRNGQPTFVRIAIWQPKELDMLQKTSLQVKRRENLA